jgi:ABC-type lipoprotein release transport system permease subunit
MSRLLYEVQPMDVATYTSSALALLLVAALAAFVPAVRATRVSPAVALRPD